MVDGVLRVMDHAVSGFGILLILIQPLSADKNFIANLIQGPNINIGSSCTPKPLNQLRRVSLPIRSTINIV